MVYLCLCTLLFYCYHADGCSCSLVFGICLKESHLFNSLNGILLSLDHPLVDHRWTLLRYLVATPNDELVRQVASAKAIAGSWRLENGTEESQ